MRLLNSIDDEGVANEDLPVFRSSRTNEQVRTQFGGKPRDLQTAGCPESSQQLRENLFLTRRWGLKSVRNPTKMVVSISGAPCIKENKLTAKFHCAYMWKSVKGARSFANGYAKKHGVDLIPFMVESHHELKDVT